MAPRDPFYHRPIAILSHDPDPFWGLPNSSVDWCEANYAHTRYVAELLNTASSLPMIAVGLYGLWLSYCYRMELRIYLCWAGIGTVGIGSLLFHGTLQGYGQAADELGMVFASMAFLYVILEAAHEEARRPWLPYIEAAYAGSFAIAYFAYPFIFPFFVISYAATVLLIIHQTYRVYKLYRDQETLAAKWQRVLFWIAATGYPGGFLFCWVPENALCPLYPNLFQMLHLHAVFHVVTTISPYCYVVFMTYHRCQVLARKAEHRLGRGLAYVHVLKSEP